MILELLDRFQTSLVAINGVGDVDLKIETLKSTTPTPLVPNGKEALSDLAK